MKNDLKDKNCLVFGMGISGSAAAALLLRMGANVTIFDENEKGKIKDELLPYKDSGRLKAFTVKLPEEVKESAGLLVLSPGIPPENPLVQELSKRNVPVTGEIELAYSCSKGRLLAITGTNGKTTTTTLLGEIMKADAASERKGREVIVVGNIGEPYTAWADSLKEDSVTVAEISSFQLETIDTFKPDVSAVLNITPDHLNRHHTMENYAAAKKRIAENQDEKDFLILNYDDPLTRKIAEDTRAKVVFFTRDPENYTGKAEFVAALKGRDIFLEGRKLISIDEVQLLGNHNYENIMAAAAMASAAGVSDDIIRETVRSFKAVEHRIEFVRTVDGADYYNDSKGTNPDASIKAVEAMVKPCILIAGGYDKESTYDELIEAFKLKGKLMVLIGETAGKIRECAERHGFNALIDAETFEDAVKLCHENAEPGDAVLLSPACASWDMFKNYEERGRLFKEYVNSL